MPGGAFGQGAERCLRVGLVAFGAQTLQLGDLLFAHARVVDLQKVDVDLDPWSAAC